MTQRRSADENNDGLSIDPVHVAAFAIISVREDRRILVQYHASHATTCPVALRDVAHALQAVDHLLQDTVLVVHPRWQQLMVYPRRVQRLLDRLSHPQDFRDHLEIEEATMTLASRQIDTRLIDRGAESAKFSALYQSATNLGHRCRDFRTTRGTHDHFNVAVLVDEHGRHHRGQRLLLGSDVVVGVGRHAEVVELRRDTEIVHRVVQEYAGPPADQSAAETAGSSESYSPKRNQCILH